MTNKELEIYQKIKSEKKLKKRQKKRAKKEFTLQETICSNLSSLASAFDTLGEIDEKLMSDPEEINKMKEKILNSMLFFCDLLPEQSRQEI